MIRNDESQPLGETLSALFAQEKDYGPPVGWVEADWIGPGIYVDPTGRRFFGLGDSIRRAELELQADTPQGRARRASIEAERRMVEAMPEEEQVQFYQAQRQRLVERALAWERKTGIPTGVR